MGTPFFRRSLICLILLAAFTAFGCLEESDVSTKVKTTKPSTPEYWKTATLEQAAIDPKPVQKAIAAADAMDGFYALVVIRKGKLVLEEYFDGANVDGLYHLRSITKNVTSALTGIAIDEGQLPGTQQTIGKYFPDLVEAEKKNIQIQHLLNMSSGLEWNENKEILFVMNNIEDPIGYALGKELRESPGKKMNYHSVMTHVLSRILEKETEKTIDQLAEENIIGPLGIQTYKWEKDPLGHCWGGFGLQLRARDLAKIGQLYLQKGNWEGKQIVPEDWVEKSTTSQIQTGVEGGGYSNQWWYAEIDFYDAPIFYGQGYGGQCLFIAPDKNLVIVAFQNHFVQSSTARNQWNNMVERVCRPIYRAAR